MPIAISGVANLPPYSPVITAPTSGSYADVSTGFTVDWTYTAATQNGQQSAWAIRRKLSSSSSYLWWSVAAQAWQASQIFNPQVASSGVAQDYIFPTGSWSDGSTYQFSMAVQDQFGISAYSADVTIIAQAAPVVVVSAPSGVISTGLPLIQWSTTLPSGTAQVAYRVVVYSQAQYLANGFVPGVSTGVWDSGLIQGQYVSQVLVPTYLTDATNFRAFVQVTETGGQTSPWVYSSFTTGFVAPNEPILVALATTDPLTGAPMVQLNFTGTDGENLLSAPDSTFETGIGSWIAVTNATVSQSNAKALAGSFSLEVEATAAGAAKASTGTYPVTPSVAYLAFLSGLTASTAEGISIGLDWYNGTTYLSSTAGDTVSDSTSYWSVSSVSGVAPVTATGVRITYSFTAAAASEIHYLDDVYFTDASLPANLAPDTQLFATWSLIDEHLYPSSALFPSPSTFPS